MRVVNEEELSAVLAEFARTEVAPVVLRARVHCWNNTEERRVAVLPTVMVLSLWTFSMTDRGFRLISVKACSSRSCA